MVLCSSDYCAGSTSRSLDMVTYGMETSLPPDSLKWLCGVVGVLAVYARVVSQQKKVPPDDKKPDTEV